MTEIFRASAPPFHIDLGKINICVEVQPITVIPGHRPYLISQNLTYYFVNAWFGRNQYAELCRKIVSEKSTTNK
jgi:hypothetical protein